MAQPSDPGITPFSVPLLLLIDKARSKRDTPALYAIAAAANNLAGLAHALYEERMEILRWVKEALDTRDVSNLHEFTRIHYTPEMMTLLSEPTPVIQDLVLGFRLPAPLVNAIDEAYTAYVANPAEETVEAIMQACEPLVDRATNGFCKSENRETYAQVARGKVRTAVGRYDPAYGARFSTYVQEALFPRSSAGGVVQTLIAENAAPLVAEAAIEESQNLMDRLLMAVPNLPDTPSVRERLARVVEDAIDSGVDPLDALEAEMAALVQPLASEPERYTGHEFRPSIKALALTVIAHRASNP